MYNGEFTCRDTSASKFDINTKFLLSSHLPNRQDMNGQGETTGYTSPVGIIPAVSIISTMVFSGALVL